MSEASHKKADHWYINKQGKVTGPFPVKLIGSYLILGRIDLDTQVSLDQKKWIPIGRLPSLIPDEIKNANTPEGRVRLHQAKLREDQRAGDSRREGAERRQGVRHDDDRRNPADRRVNEEVISAAHVKLKADLMARKARSKKIIATGLVVVIAVSIAIIAGLFMTEPGMVVDKTDCFAPAKNGVDWESCNKNNADLVSAQLANSNLHSIKLNGALLVNANLSAAELSYASLENANLSEANLQKTVLKGANLNNANLTGASLVEADLSYADLNSAIILNAKVLNTRFDHAIWTDGRRCAKGSVDQCVFK